MRILNYILLAWFAGLWGYWIFNEFRFPRVQGSAPTLQPLDGGGRSRERVAAAAGASSDKGKSKEQPFDLQHSSRPTPPVAQLRARALANKSLEAEAYRRARVRMSIAVAYGRLFSQLRLSAADETKLIQLLAERESINDDLNAAVAQQRDLARAADPMKAIREAKTALEASVSDQLAALLGPERLAAFNQYQETLSQNLVVTELQQICALIGAPLSDSQASAVLQALLAEPPKPTELNGAVLPVSSAWNPNLAVSDLNFQMLPSGAWFVDPNGMLAVNYPVPEATEPKIRARLDSRQLQALTALVERKNAQRQIANTFNYTK